MHKEELINKLIEQLDNAKVGDDIRAVMFTMIQFNFQTEDIKKVLESTTLTEEKIEEIEKQEEGKQR
jgi:hypothetical protein